MDEYVSNCSACGKSHSIKFYKLFVPRVIRGAGYGHMGYCSTADKYVYMKKWMCGPSNSALHTSCAVANAVLHSVA
jgi:hypothetical protein